MSGHSEDNLIQYLKGKNEEHSGFLGQKKATILNNICRIIYPNLPWFPSEWRVQMKRTRSLYIWDYGYKLYIQI
ncbi:hypothetical protein H6G81_15825 [Scytonema hofmannii FACHB-248]|uniref:Uncharacterized protein n=1 Tax=Scytonema hofmannii FACHB-248 TaxID=1842502 RepID=A0ABR8GSC7_9CYAN|nr:MULTISPECIES: hypothetical protein [Nostocales]MBD2605949.1 hypothetical protein [Scytonema hofmannii FACHB-248]